jgi:putative ABC transport system substrate-binding protein
VFRRSFLGRSLAAGAVVALGSCAVPEAKRPIPQLGYSTGPSSSDVTKQLLEAFQEGLRTYGYVDGQSIQIAVRYSKGREEEWDEFATEFVGIPVDVIVAAGTTAAWQAAMKATKTIPIVVTMPDDPVAAGRVASLARPGGNVTGIANTLTAASGKRLELVSELVPGIRRFGAIWNGAIDQAGAASVKGAKDAARSLAVEVIELAVPTPSSASDTSGLTLTLQRATERNVEALLVGAVPFYISDRAREIVAYALERRIPLASEVGAQWVDAGGLVALGHDQRETHRRMAYFVDRILKGAKPGDLPMEQPATYETIINLKTAKAIGLNVPQAILGRATRVIQ